MNFYINNLQNYLEEWQKEYCHSQQYVDLVESYKRYLRCSSEHVVWYKNDLIHKKRMFDFYCHEQEKIKHNPFDVSLFSKLYEKYFTMPKMENS